LGMEHADVTELTTEEAEKPYDEGSFLVVLTDRCANRFLAFGALALRLPAGGGCDRWAASWVWLASHRLPARKENTP
jgi:hypothetical protein